MQPDNSTKRKYLLMYGKAVREEREAREEYEQLRLGGLLPKSPSLNENNTGSRTDHSAYFARLEIMIEKDLKPKQLKKLRIRESIIDCIEKLPTEQERTVMRARYLHLIQTEYEKKIGLEGTKYMTWKQVADYCGYSKQGVKKIHGTALRNVTVPERWLKKIAREEKSRPQ